MATPSSSDSRMLGKRLNFRDPDNAADDKVKNGNEPLDADDKNRFDTVKVFSATKHLERQNIGDVITAWIRSNPDLVIVDKIVTQSSDSEFHCLVITLFCRKA